MNWEGAVLDSIIDAGGDEIFVISTISTFREKVPGRNDAMKVFPLKGTFKMDKEFSNIYSDGQLT